MHKTMRSIIKNSGCLDLYNGQRSNPIMQTLNALIDANTPRKQLQQGLVHANGIMLLRLMKDPNSHATETENSSAEYLIRNFNKIPSIDINWFAGLPLVFLVETEQGLVSQVKGYLRLRPLLT